MHSLRAGNPIRAIVQAAAAHHFTLAGTRPFGIARIGARKTFREPVRHPFPHVAGKILYAEGARAFRMGTDKRNTILVHRILVRYLKARVLSSGWVIAPWIYPLVCATR